MLILILYIFKDEIILINCFFKGNLHIREEIIRFFSLIIVIYSVQLFYYPFIYIYLYTLFFITYQ